MLQITFLALALLSTLVGSGCTPKGPPSLLQAPQAGDITGGITVSGECLRKVTQDRGSVTVSSSKVLPTSRQASEAVMESHEQVKSKVKELGLKDFTPETANYSVGEERVYENKKWVSKGYRATLSTRFETSEIRRLGEVMTVAAELGADRVGGLNVFVSPEKLKSEREACLEIAMQNAAAKAERIAVGAAVQVDRILEVKEVAENNGSGHFSGKAYYAAEFDGGSEPVAMNAGKGPVVEMKPIDLAVKLTARFGIKN